MSKLKQSKATVAKKATSNLKSKTIKKSKKSTPKVSQKKGNMDSASKECFSIKEKDLVSLPAIDMNDPESKIIPQIMKMLTEVGFLHLRNVPGFDEDKLLADIKKFH